MGSTRGDMTARPTPNDLYSQAAADFGGALTRLARAYEADPDQRRDLLQEIHLALWRSFATFNGDCSVRTWVYRVAHNTAASHAQRRQRLKLDKMTSIDDLAALEVPDPDDPTRSAEDHDELARLMALIQRLKMPDRQILLLYLEGLDAESIGEICGLTGGAVATKVYRLKDALAKRFHQGGTL